MLLIFIKTTMFHDMSGLVSITVDQVSSILNSIIASKATGLDELPARFIIILSLQNLLLTLYFFVNLILLRTIMLLYFNRAPFMLAHCPIDDICLPVFENIYILIIVLLCLFIYAFYFLK